MSWRRLDEILTSPHLEHSMTSSFFTPREIVSELDRFIIGQHEAKRAVAIALRNRWRRQKLPEAMREEVLPKNILMIGPTGVGKTEISRRLAKLAQAPFIKVEATKFTEVGYVGRDVEQIVRDLIEVGIALVRAAKRKEVEAQAEAKAEERVLNALVGSTSQSATRESFRRRLRQLGKTPCDLVGACHRLARLRRRRGERARRRGRARDRRLDGPADHRRRGGTIVRAFAGRAGRCGGSFARRAPVPHRRHQQDNLCDGVEP